MNIERLDERLKKYIQDPWYEIQGNLIDLDQLSIVSSIEEELSIENNKKHIFYIHLKSGYTLNFDFDTIEEARKERENLVKVLKLRSTPIL